jgi:hypothetical protein
MLSLGPHVLVCFALLDSKMAERTFMSKSHTAVAHGNASNTTATTYRCGAASLFLYLSPSLYKDYRAKRMCSKAMYWLSMSVREKEPKLKRARGGDMSSELYRNNWNEDG